MPTNTSETREQRAERAAKAIKDAVAKLNEGITDEQRAESLRKGRQALRALMRRVSV